MGVRHFVSMLGSGLLPFLGTEAFPNAPPIDTAEIKTIEGQPVIIVNPEEFSVHTSGDTTHKTLAAGVAQRIDLGIPGRRAIKITNTSTTSTVFIGFRGNITVSGATGGDALLPTQAITINCKNILWIYAISSSNVLVTVMEVS